MVAEQLDIFRQPVEPEVTPDPEPRPRRTQITELPGETFEDIFKDAA